jgi:CRP-like cAMP-binding protein
MCTRDELAQIAAAATTISFPAGTELARAGEVGREFMVMVEGTAEVAVNGVVVNQLGPNDYFGEIALLDGGLRTATVTATTDVVAHVIEQREFAVLLFDSPSLARKLLVGLAKRLRAAQVPLDDIDRTQG